MRVPGLVLFGLTVVVAVASVVALAKRLAPSKPPGIVVPTAFINPLFLLSFLLAVFTVYQYVIHR